MSVCEELVILLLLLCARMCVFVCDCMSVYVGFVCGCVCVCQWGFIPIADTVFVYYYSSVCLQLPILTTCYYYLYKYIFFFFVANDIKDHVTYKASLASMSLTCFLAIGRSSHRAGGQRQDGG